MALFASEIANSAHLINIEKVTYFGPNDGIFCEIDNDATQDAVTNILSNADRFRIPNSIIEITLECSDTNVILSIANHGPLIRDSEIDHIFECGFSTTPDEPDAGSGIGLFAAKSYINKMGGTITATNLEDGVRFDIHFPVLRN